MDEPVWYVQCVHVKDSAGYVGAIKEHFCSAGRCDDSFMRVPEEKREPEVDEVRDEQADWQSEAWVRGADRGSKDSVIAATFSARVMSLVRAAVH